MFSQQHKNISGHDARSFFTEWQNGWCRYGNQRLTYACSVFLLAVWIQTGKKTLLKVCSSSGSSPQWVSSSQWVLRTVWLLWIYAPGKYFTIVDQELLIQPKQRWLKENSNLEHIKHIYIWKILCLQIQVLIWTFFTHSFSCQVSPMAPERSAAIRHRHAELRRRFSSVN